MLTKVTVRARINAGFASTNKTLRIISHVLAPVETAASITPLSTSLKAPSTSLAKNAIDAIDNDTDAASAPMDVPTRILVTGINTIIKIINGIERMILIMVPAIPFMILFLKNNGFDVK